MLLVCYGYSYCYKRVYNLINLNYGFIFDYSLNYGLGYSLDSNYNNIGGL